MNVLINWSRSRQTGLTLVTDSNHSLKALGHSFVQVLRVFVIMFYCCIRSVLVLHYRLFAVSDLSQKYVTVKDEDK